jgi:GrpB protein
MRGQAVSAEQLVVRSYDRRGRLSSSGCASVPCVFLATSRWRSSTLVAVPGLAAKPVIDLDVVVASPDDVGTALGRLATLGYEPDGRSGVVETVAGLTAPRWPRGGRRHHLDIVVAGRQVHRERLAFRDYLRTHPRRGTAPRAPQAGGRARRRWRLGRVLTAQAREFIQRVRCTAPAVLRRAPLARERAAALTCRHMAA